MNQSLKVWHLLLIAGIAFVIYYLMVQNGGHGKQPGVPSAGDTNTVPTGQGILLTK